jgi:hypothetical protein
MDEAEELSGTVYAGCVVSFPNWLIGDVCTSGDADAAVVDMRNQCLQVHLKILTWISVVISLRSNRFETVLALSIEIDKSFELEMRSNDTFSTMIRNLDFLQKFY